MSSFDSFSFFFAYSFRRVVAQWSQALATSFPSERGARFAPAYERKDDPRPVWPAVSFAKAVLPGKDRWHSAVLIDVVSSHNLQNKKIILFLWIFNLA